LFLEYLYVIFVQMNIDQSIAELSGQQKEEVKKLMDDGYEIISRTGGNIRLQCGFSYKTVDSCGRVY
jgi:hypothetical protein